MLNILYTYFHFKINPSLHSTLSPPLTLTHSPLYLSLISSQISYVTEKNRFDRFLLFFASRCTYLFIYIIISMYFLIERKERERESSRCKSTVGEREREREREKRSRKFISISFFSHKYINMYISHIHPNDRSMMRPTNIYAMSVYNSIFKYNNVRRGSLTIVLRIHSLYYYPRLRLRRRRRRRRRYARVSLLQISSTLSQSYIISCLRERNTTHT